ncbi:hypothetical protein [Propionivibrio soli]|uniref:hypothetical protein n=1 Tax=Propionivibrio soli TaxID=2976531 RepID=UPI0021E7E1E3|nr:hypothetical protein [Propionivibrio soli]
MDLSATLYITPKGEEEVKHRTYKLHMKRRSVLILLDKPKTLGDLLGKVVFQGDEALTEIGALIREGFIGSNGKVPIPPPASAASALPAQPAALPAAGSPIGLDPEIILSEAKFLLTDFAVDSFGTQSEAIAGQVHACKSVRDVEVCLVAIRALAEKVCPAQLPALQNVIAEINATAA